MVSFVNRATKNASGNAAGVFLFYVYPIDQHTQHKAELSVFGIGFFNCFFITRKIQVDGFRIFYLFHIHKLSTHFHTNKTV